MVESYIRKRIGYVVLNNPEKRNALSPEMVSALKTVIKNHLEDEAVKIIVIKAEGKVFCSGADLGYLKKIREFTFAENVEDGQNLRELFDMIYHGNKLFIAEVQGPALAGGCGLATICDLCIASDNASFGYTEARIGFVPALVMVYLRHRISGAHMRQLLLTSEIITSSRALEIGLVDRVVDQYQLEEKTAQVAEELCDGISGSSIALTKTMLREVADMPLKEALDYAAHKNAEARSSADCIRGIDAFLSKEKIQW